MGSGLAKAIEAENERVATTDLMTMKNKLRSAVLNNKFRANRLRIQGATTREGAEDAYGEGIALGLAKGAGKYAKGRVKRSQRDNILKELDAILDELKTGTLEGEDED